MRGAGLLGRLLHNGGQRWVNRNGQTKLEGGVDPRREGIVLGDGAL